jgi:hypothetical protein
MEVTPTRPPIRLDLCDAALLVAFAVLAAVGTRQASLLFADGAVSLAAAWLFDFWDLLLAQVPTRAVGLMALYGPAWVLRWALGPAAETYVVVAHILYFGVPLLLWLVIRAVQSHPAFARLYLCLALMLVFYPSELIVGLGIWLVWAAIVAKPGRSRAAVVLVTAGFAVPLAFTHPATGLISLLYMLTGGLLAAAGRPFPRQALIAAAAMTALLLCAFLVTDALLPPTNPTVTMVLATSRYFYIDPVWMAATLTVYPLLAVLSLLMLIPSLGAASARLRVRPFFVLCVAAFGLWFAANGTNLMTWIFARQTASYFLVLSLAFAIASPEARWLEEARRPLMLFAGVMVVASLSTGFDMALFDRAVEKRLAPIEQRAQTTPALIDLTDPATSPWESKFLRRLSLRGYFKWLAADDYLRDVVIPNYGGESPSLAFYTYFRSARGAVLYRTLDQQGDWVPLECAPVDRALVNARDDTDRRFLHFLSERYCVR